MNYNTLDTVVLARDLPEEGLRQGDLGAVVEVYEPDGLEVEFVRASRPGYILLKDACGVPARHPRTHGYVAVR